MSVILHPAEADTGLRFCVSKRGRVTAEIPAKVCNVKNLTLCTVIGNDEGVTVGTVEHLLAALRGLSVDNCIIEIDSKEVPIMDGSSAQFVEAIDEAGIRELSAPRKYLKVLKPIRVEEGECWGELTPHSGFHLDVEIDFPTPLIGRQRLAFEMSPGVFRNELAHARTFGFMSDVERLWKAGLALGANLTNTVAIGDDQGHEPRRSARPARIRPAQDAGCCWRSQLVRSSDPRCLSLGASGGHRLNSYVLKALLEDTSAWAIVHAPRVRSTRSLGFERSAIAAAGE